MCREELGVRVGVRANVRVSVGVREVYQRGGEGFVVGVGVFSWPERLHVEFPQAWVVVVGGCVRECV